MANQEVRKEFESQLESVSAFLENEIDKLKGPQRKQPPSQHQVTTRKETEKFAREMESMLKSFLGTSVDLGVEHEKESSSVDDGGSALDNSDQSKVKRKLFVPAGMQGRRLADASTQTEEAFSHHLYTAEALETLSSSICRKLMNYLDERLMVPSANSYSDNYRDRDRDRGLSSLDGELSTSYQDFKMSSTNSLLPSLKAISSPIGSSSDIFSESLIPNMPHSLNLDYSAKSLKNRGSMSESARRQELSELMHNPINPPFSRSPKSKGIRRSEYESIRRKHYL